MWKLSLPWWEFAARGLIIYGLLIVLLRVTGKRQIGQMSPFDLVLLLLISNAVQNAMNGGDNSLLGGVILAAVLIFANALLGWLTNRSRAVEKFIEGEPEVLILDGKVQLDTVEREGLSEDEIDGAIRAAGCEKIEEVHLATLEVNGEISIVRRENGDRPRVRRVRRRRRTKGRPRGFGG